MRTKYWLILPLFILVSWLGYEILQPDTQALIRLYGPSESFKLDYSRPLKEQKRLAQIGDRTFNIPIMYASGSLDNCKL